MTAGPAFGQPDDPGDPTFESLEQFAADLELETDGMTAEERWAFIKARVNERIPSRHRNLVYRILNFARGTGMGSGNHGTSKIEVSKDGVKGENLSSADAKQIAIEHQSAKVGNNTAVGPVPADRLAALRDPANDAAAKEPAKKDGGAVGDAKSEFAKTIGKYAALGLIVGVSGLVIAGIVGVGPAKSWFQAMAGMPSVSAQPAPAPRPTGTATGP